MDKKEQMNMLFVDYFSEWIELYKRGAVRDITFNKYLATKKSLEAIAPTLKLCDLDKKNYQTILNEYAKSHEKQTVKDFNCQLKAVVLDAVEEGLLPYNPARKIVIKGKPSSESKKQKFLNIDECRKLSAALDLVTPIFSGERTNHDWLILLCMKTGVRFSEALGLTPCDFDFENFVISISKTWNYKKPTGGFIPTKNLSSIRKIGIDIDLAQRFETLLKGADEDRPVFVPKGKRIFNSTVNSRLERLCVQSNIPVISMHSLRHTHGSVLLAAGVSILSISKRLGHSDVATTQEVYMHLIKELEEKDNEKIISSLSLMVA